jgi:hypothetical protein
MVKPRHVHLIVEKHVLRYLKGYIDLDSDMFQIVR